MNGRPCNDDEAGAFPVFEAVMVAILIFTAILFFTGVGRPSDPSEAGGIDLAQNAADILSILETREFGSPTAVPMQDVGATPGWVTLLVQESDQPDGITAPTRGEVDDLISEIVPAGALYVLRLSNGKEPNPPPPFDSGVLELSPGGGRIPHGARAAEIFLLPDSAYAELEAPAGAGTPYPVYGLQLVVWFGA